MCVPNCVQMVYPNGLRINGIIRKKTNSKKCQKTEFGGCPSWIFGWHLELTL